MDITINRESKAAQGTQLTVSLEVVLIMTLTIFSLFVRVVSLNLTPISETEVIPALAAWRTVIPSASGAPVLTDSAILFWSQAISFSLVGGGEVAARIMTALGGTLLTLTPFLFRDLIGKTRAFVVALIWSMSPVLLAASRFSSPVVWSGLFAMVTLWALWRYWQSTQREYALFAMMSGAALIFLSESGAPVLALILVASGFVALTFTSLDAPMDADLPPDDYLQDVRGRFAAWPTTLGLIAGGLLVFVVATGFMLYPKGLSIIGEMWGQFFAGFTTAQAGAPVLYPLASALFYETFLVIFGMFSILFLILRGEHSYTDRFLIAWVAFGTLAALIYRGGTAAHALWIVLPLGALIAEGVVLSLQDIAWADLWTANIMNDHAQRYAKLAVAGIVFVLCLVSAMHFQVASRGFWIATNGSLTDFLGRLNESAFDTYTVGLIWFLIALLFIVVGYFLASSLLGALIPVQGLWLGMVAFMLVTSFGSGWNLIGARANDADELWFINGTTREATLLRQTLMDLSFRETGGFPEIPVVVVGGDTGVLAWELRDFPNARYVEAVADARGAEIVIMPSDFVIVDEMTGVVREPDLGAAYVGQDFTLTQMWRASWLQGMQALAWWSDRVQNVYPKSLAPQPQTLETVFVWVRQDIYDSSPFDPSLFEDIRE